MLRYWEILLGNLVFLIFVMPLVGAGLVAISAKLGLDAIRRTALTNILLTFALTLLMAVNYDPSKESVHQTPELVQMKTSMPWLQNEMTHLEIQESDSGETKTRLVVIPTGPDVRFSLGVDGVSLWFVMLTSTLMIPATLAGWGRDLHQPALFHGLLLLLQSSLVGVFAALDVVLFVICLELISIPLFLLIGRWGGYERRRLLVRFFLYKLAGTLLVAFALLLIVVAHTRMWAVSYRGVHAPVFTIAVLIDGSDSGEATPGVPGLRNLLIENEYARQYWSSTSPWIFLALLAGFAVHAAIVPMHSWLASINSEAPTSASLIVTGIGLFVGCYGLLRFLVPLFPATHLNVIPFLPALSILGGIYAGLLALGQDDMKKLATYAGVSRVSLVIAGTLSGNPTGIMGGLLLSMSTGLSLAVVLFLIGILEERYQTREIESFSGLQRKYPRLGLCFLIAALSLIGMPGLGGFLGQFLTLVGLFEGSPTLAANPLSTCGGLIVSLLVAGAFVRLIQKCFRGPLREPFFSNNLPPHSESMTGKSAQSERTPMRGDLAIHEMTAVLVCLSSLVTIGVSPRLLMSRMQSTVVNCVNGQPGESESFESDQNARKHSTHGISTFQSESDYSMRAMVPPIDSMDSTIRRVPSAADLCRNQGDLLIGRDNLRTAREL